MHPNEKEHDFVPAIHIGRESFGGRTWTYDLNGCRCRDGRLSVHLDLTPEPCGAPDTALISEIYIGTEEEVRARAVQTVRHWTAVRGLIQQLLGPDAAVPLEAPQPRQLQLWL